MRKIFSRILFNSLPSFWQNRLLHIKPSLGNRLSTERILKLNYNTQMSFILIGANDGVSFDSLNQQLQDVPKLKGIAIEPIKQYFYELKQNYSKYKDVKCINAALHPTDKYTTLYKVDPRKLNALPEWSKGIASILREHHKVSGIPTEYIVEEKVDCINFTTLINQYGFKELNGRYNYLQIDVEGYDAEIIKMIDFQEIKFDVIKFERINLNKLDFESTVSKLKMEGYSVYNQTEDCLAVKNTIKLHIN